MVSKWVSHRISQIICRALHCYCCSASFLKGGSPHTAGAGHRPLHRRPCESTAAWHPSNIPPRGTKALSATTIITGLPDTQATEANFDMRVGARTLPPAGLVRNDSKRNSQTHPDVICQVQNVRTCLWQEKCVMIAKGTPKLTQTWSVRSKMHGLASGGKTA